MAIPCECDKCEKMFDLAPLLNKYPEDTLMKDFLYKEFKDGTAVCEACRG